MSEKNNATYHRPPPVGIHLPSFLIQTHSPTSKKCTRNVSSHHGVRCQLDLMTASKSGIKSFKHM